MSVRGMIISTLQEMHLALIFILSNMEYFSSMASSNIDLLDDTIGHLLVFSIQYNMLIKIARNHRVEKLLMKVTGSNIRFFFFFLS